jgi:hypothetical protein
VALPVVLLTLHLTLHALALNTHTDDLASIYRSLRQNKQNFQLFITHQHCSMADIYLSNLFSTDTYSQHQVAYCFSIFCFAFAKTITLESSQLADRKF